MVERRIVRKTCKSGYVRIGSAFKEIETMEWKYIKEEKHGVVMV